MKALVIDLRDRDCRCHAASVTRTTRGGLVLRHALYVGRLFDGLPVAMGGWDVIVTLGRYQARGSCGFAEAHGGAVAAVVGLMGRGWLAPEHADSTWSGALRRVDPPDYAAVITPTGVMTITAPAAPSNRAVAEAAAFAAAVMAGPDRLLVLEGQSDWVRICEIQGAPPDWTSFPAEHREDIIDPATPKPQPNHGARYVLATNRSGEEFAWPSWEWEDREEELRRRGWTVELDPDGVYRGAPPSLRAAWDGATREDRGWLAERGVTTLTQLVKAVLR